jgi:hypothetical protein
MTLNGAPFDWARAITELRSSPDQANDAPTLVGELARSGAGSAPMLFLADDDKQYWVKFPGNPQGTQTLVAETIVAAIAPLIDAPTRETRRLRIPPAHVGTPYGKDQPRQVPSGLAHGSLLIENATEQVDELRFARRDDNARRIPRLLVLWDWAMGTDAQWLHDDDANSTIWSFDHGLWLDAGPGAWTPEGIRTAAEGAWTLQGTIPPGISATEFYSAATALEAVAPEQIAAAVANVPPEWKPDNGLLGALGETLYARRRGAAARARALGTSITKGGRA